MASQKDKDYHKLRNPEKYSELKSIVGDTYGHLNKESAEAYARYKALWSKYGQKSMVCDKRRRNTDRKSNQKDKQILHQIQRARYKLSFQNHLINQDYAINAEYGKGTIYSRH
jgi:hypothetical protein